MSSSSSSSSSYFRTLCRSTLLALLVSLALNYLAHNQHLVISSVNGNDKQRTGGGGIVAIFESFSSRRTYRNHCVLYSIVSVLPTLIQKHMPSFSVERRKGTATSLWFIISRGAKFMGMFFFSLALANADWQHWRVCVNPQRFPI